MITATGYLPLLLERLSRDHARIAGVVRRLAELAETLEQEPDWHEIAEHIDFLDYYADKVHHPLEDRVFDALVNKGLTPTERHLVFKNLGQHEEITSLTQSLARQAAGAVSGTLTPDVPDFDEALQAYIALQIRHMRFEESQLFPLLEQGLDNSDWNALTRTLGAPDQDEPAEQAPCRAANR